MSSRANLYAFLRISLLTALIAVALSVAEYGELKFFYVGRGLLHDRGPAYAAIYYFGYILSVVGLVILVNLRSKVASYSLVAFMILALASQMFVKSVFSEVLSQEHFAVAVENNQWVWNFVFTYSYNIAITVDGSALVICLFTFLVRKFLPAFGWKACFVPLSGAIVIAIVTWRTNGALAGFPSPYRVPTIAALSVMRTPLYVGERAPVSSDMVPMVKSDANIIFLVVDESISAGFLNIDGFKLPTTPYLSSTASQYINLGKASSAGNHSALTNMILQSGLRVDEVPDGAQLALRNPNIFQYAKKAGYWTVYIDAQVLPKGFNNYMRSADLRTIGLFYRVSEHEENEPIYQRDRLMLQPIREIIRKHEKVFFYIVKMGAHFPYETTYPPEQRFFSPTMAPGSSLAGSSVAEIWGSYENAVRWSVDLFLEEFLPKVDLQRSIVIYTGDHGQSIEDDGQGVGTHGKVEAPPRSQATVPLLLFGKPAEFRLRPVLPAVFDRASHFQLFPSLLIMMGYPEEEATKRFGAPLWVPAPVPRAFLSGDLFLRGRAFVNRFD